MITKKIVTKIGVIWKTTVKIDTIVEDMLLEEELR